MSRKMLTGIILIFLVIVGYVYFSTKENSQGTSESKVDKPSAEVGQAVSQKFASENKEPVTDNRTLTEIGKSFQECSEVLSYAEKYKPRFRSPSKIPEEISANYDDEDIAIWIEKNSDAYTLDAINWLSNQRTRRSDYEIRRKKQNQIALNHNRGLPLEPDVGRMKAVGYSLNSPQYSEAWFIEILKKDKQKKHTILSEMNIVATDISLLLNSEKINDNEIIFLLDYVKDLNSYTRFGERFIYDVAKSNRMAVFDALLSRGVQVEDTRFSTNLLEQVVSLALPTQKQKDAMAARDMHYEISKYRYKFEFHERKEMITKLMALGLPYRWTKIDPFHNKVGAKYGSLTGRNSERKERLLSTLGWFPSDEPERDPYLELPSTLIAALEEVKDNYYREILGEQKYLLWKNCRKQQAFIFRQPGKTAEQIISDTRLQYDTDGKVESALSRISPLLVDCFRRSQSGANFSLVGKNNQLAVVNAVGLYRSGEKEEALSRLGQLVLDKNGKHFVFWAAVRKNIEDLADLIQAGYLPDSQNFREVSLLDVERFKNAISHAGDFKGADSTGKTLVYHTTASCRIPLLKHLQENGYDYHSDIFGEDALAVAIRDESICHRHFKKSENRDQDKLNLITTLMKFRPKINAHHLKLMAKLKMENYRVYQKIVENFPELEADEAVEPNLYTCQYLKQYQPVYVY